MNETTEVKLHFLDYWRTIKLRMGLILLTFFLVMVTAGVTTYFMPREYFSRVRMEVKPDGSGPIGMFNSGMMRSYDPQFVATQFQILQTTEILYPVIERLELVKEFSPAGQRLPMEQVYRRLRRSMQLQEVRNTGLIDIGVFDVDHQRAANIANTIGVVYVERRRSDLQKIVSRGLEQVQEEVTKQRQVVLVASSEAANLRTKGGIVDPDPDKDGVTLGHKSGIAIVDEQAFKEQERRTKDTKLHLELIQNAKVEELPQILHMMGFEDPTVSTTVATLQQFRVGEQRLLSSGVGENHPQIKSLRGQIGLYQSQLQTALDGQISGLASRYKMESKKLDDYRLIADDARKGQIEEQTSMKDYIDAKNRYIQERRILETAEVNLKAERMKKEIDVEPAKIWEKAEVSLSPARPNVPTYMIVAAVVGIFLGVALAFFIEYLDTSVKKIGRASCRERV